MFHCLPQTINPTNNKPSCRASRIWKRLPVEPLVGVSSAHWCHLELLRHRVPCPQLVLSSSSLSTEQGSLLFASSSGACRLNTQGRANTSLGGALLSPDCPMEAGALPGFRGCPQLSNRSRAPDGSHAYDSLVLQASCPVPLTHRSRSG